MTDVRVLLARNMKRCREILGISQMKLAEKVGCSPTLIGKIEIMKHCNLWIRQEIYLKK